MTTNANAARNYDTHIALIGNTEVLMGDIIRVQGKPYRVIDEPTFHTFEGVRSLRWVLAVVPVDNPGIERSVWYTDPEGNAVLLARD